MVENLFLFRIAYEAMEEVQESSNSKHKYVRIDVIQTCLHVNRTAG